MVKEIPKHICEVCKKREATRLCDFVTAEWQWCGHPPKDSKDQRMSGHNTCDKMMCDKCSVRFNETDFCQKHYKIITGRVAYK